MKPRIAIVVPRLDDSGPVKGALALLSGLKDRGYTVAVITLFSQNSTGKGFFAFCKRFYEILVAFKCLKKLKKRGGLVVISYCLLPDFLNFITGQNASAIASIRGDLESNYSDTYGSVGIIIAHLHYRIAGKLGTVLVLNNSMLATCQTYGIDAIVVENFIDEIAIERKITRLHTPTISKNIKFIFVGGLTKRKAILELIEVFIKLNKTYVNSTLDILGDGPERRAVLAIVGRYKIENKIILHGHLADPIPYIVSSDVFVLPSLSEGTSRAAMEALYAGVPCILRNVDSNCELISSPERGRLVDDSDQLFDAMAEYCKKGVCRYNKSLLPVENQFNEAVSKMVKIIESVSIHIHR